MMRALDRDDATAIAGVAMSATMVTPGTLLFVRNNWLVSQPFDVERRALTGAAHPVAGPVDTFQDTLGAAFSASSLARIVFRPPADALSLQLEWRARDGRCWKNSADRNGPRRCEAQCRRHAPRRPHRRRAERPVALGFDTRREEPGDCYQRMGERIGLGRRQARSLRLGRQRQHGPLRNTTDGTDERKLLASAPDATLWPSDWSRDGRTLVGADFAPTPGRTCGATRSTPTKSHGRSEHPHERVCRESRRTGSGSLFSRTKPVNWMCTSRH